MDDAQATAAAAPRPWQDHPRFCALDTGGSGLLKVLQLWQAWRQAPGRCQQLHLVWLADDAAAAEAALQQAQGQSAGLATDLLPRLLATWPPLTPNLHPLILEPGRVHLLLGLGPLSRLLPRLRLQARLLWLQAAAQQPTAQRLHLLKALARQCAPGALALGAAPSAELLADLRTAGFEQEATAPAGSLQARMRPHPGPRRSPGRSPSHTPGAGPNPGPNQCPNQGLLAQAQPANDDAAPPALTEAHSPRTALVIGAGVAGAAAAQALLQLGLQVTVLDRHATAAAETSGNPAGLFHGTVNPDDGPYARLFRAAALVAQRDYAASTAPRQNQGLLRLQPPQADGLDPLPAMQAQLQRLGLPDGYVQALDAGQATALAGLPLAAPAWFYPAAGWVSPAHWVREVLGSPGLCFQGGVTVHSLQPTASGWQALDAAGQVLGQAEVLVLACALGSQRLVQALSPGLPWPLRQTRGQVTQVQGGLHGDGPNGPQTADRPLRSPPQAALRLPLAGDGYALPLQAAEAWLCGATRQAVALQDRPGPFALQAATETPARAETAPTAADHAHNLQRLQRLTGMQPAAAAVLLGRVGYRLHSDDRLPIAGAVPRLDLPTEPRPGTPDAASCGNAASGRLLRADQARRWPRWPGLFVLTALGARGLTLAPLLGRLVAAQATGAPWPLEQELADAVDPVRWALRAARSTQAQAQAAGRGPEGAAPGQVQEAG